MSEARIEFILGFEAGPVSSVVSSVHCFSSLHQAYEWSLELHICTTS